MGNGIASWPSSLLIPATTSVITITLSALWEKLLRKDLQVMITLGIACCTQHIWLQDASYLPGFWQLMERFKPAIIQTIKGAGQVHCECTWVFLRHCQGKNTSCVLSGRVRVIDCYWKLSSFTLCQVWNADTQQVELMQTGPIWLFVKVS